MLIVYMLVTNDKFELPVSPPMEMKEFSKFVGRNKDSIHKTLMARRRYNKTGRINGKIKIIQVKLDDRENDE